MNSIVRDIVLSWANQEGNVNSNKEIIDWVNRLNQSLTVDIKNSLLSKSDFWFYSSDTGCIQNKNNSFFSITGLRVIQDGETVIEQPMIIQDEIGYLGIICKEMNGVLNFLMQAKIEPGNINKIQISPTIQATKSNFTRQHGGKSPAYLDYFFNANKHTIVVDQIQSEQSSRFYKKRNRNTIVKVDEEIEILPSHKWMTLGQIKELMKIDNLVNMDTRTVLSCIPFVFQDLSEKELEEVGGIFKDKTLFNSIFNSNKDESFTTIYKYINDYKMFCDNKVELVRLNELDTWEMNDYGIMCKEPYSFSVIYCDIEVEGREVTKWTQPLFKAEGLATFGLLTTVENNIRKFLIKCRHEVGCFDQMELGPTIQREAIDNNNLEDCVAEVFNKHLAEDDGILYNVVLSEEGGRFYHEQNHNVIIEIDKGEILDLPEGYFWIDYRSLNQLVQINNCLNIQLRNLLSLLEV